MLNNNQDIYSDQYQVNDDFDRKQVETLNEHGKKSRSDVDQQNIEDLLRISRQLKTSRSQRFIDEHLDQIPTKLKSNVESLVLSCNYLARTKPIDWKNLPKNLQTLDLSGNFLSEIDEKEFHGKNLVSLALSINEFDRIPSILVRCEHLSLLDLSQNLLSDLEGTVQLLKLFKQLRIVYLHGNPLSLIVDYRVYLIDSLEKLMVLDDVRITTEERFRCRNSSRSTEHPKTFSSLTIHLDPIRNIPAPINTLVDVDWPIRVHRYQIRFDWFEQNLSPVDIPLDKYSNYRRFKPDVYQTSYSEYKTNIDLTPNDIQLKIDDLVSFRDFLFHGTNVRLIDQITDYWPPGESTISSNDQKKKPRSTSQENKDKKTETNKKKKTEDFSKLSIRSEPTENVLFEFPVDLRSLLDGDYLRTKKFEIQLDDSSSQTQNNNNNNKNEKKQNKKSESSLDRQQTMSSKLSKGKDKKTSKEEKSVEQIQPVEPTTFSIEFRLHRFVSNEQIL